MAFVLKWARGLTRRAPLVPLRFPTSGFKVVPDSVLLEEQHFDEFKAGHYYPMNIGDVLVSKYQVIGKLGFGTTSTVWLARNLRSHDYVALKVYTQDQRNRDEFRFLDIISKANPSHPGYPNVRTALDIFELSRSGRDHYCLVQRPMWDSWKDLLRRNSSGCFSEPLLKAGLRHLFTALDYLHSECKLVHTGKYLKADNILQDIADQSILEAFTQTEFASPSARKFVGDLVVYESRTFDLPRKFGGPVLSDFGAAVRGDLKRNHDAQPAVYRSPEVMLKTEWSYPVDIWNVGVMDGR
ncbi:hypothetical protein QQZ08_004033 [Neonectria magnoliae]|uniref:non-specific serine/threonine protein kinase n=1 Tax=Neonectria magnoliae TaxID=2732573 RepID=A0ABR1I800_9HYPO